MINQIKNKKLIYLVDLTHRGFVLSSNVFPLSIGLIGAYLLNKRKEEFEVVLFKYPEDFSSEFEKRKPDVIGFANYSWNFNISYEFAKVIKSITPNIPIIFGGPNYGLEKEEINEFWKKNKFIDFYIVREGEEAFLQLIEILLINDMNYNKIKESNIKLSNCHYLYKNEVIIGPDLPRLNLEDIPSPYLMGLMDKFFDLSLAPMIHTTRGCPFSCTFCTEGSPYYNIVEQRMATLLEELDYIAKRVRGPLDLYISDANFGMFKQDVEKAQLLMNLQKKYGYPRYIHVSTGKNQKERVIEIAKMLDGALSMAASLQSTDSIVLKNVSRSNISINKLTEVGKLANKVETGTYSEIILGLPGDNFEAHCQSLRECVNAKFDNIRMYQLIMLPQTELNTPESRKKYGIKSKHRIMPRSFGRYKLEGHSFIAVESEEILIENFTLSFEDYIKCRELDLTVELLHNGKIYEEIQTFCENKELSWFDFILRFYEKRRKYTAEISLLYDEFKYGLTSRLWENSDEIVKAVTENFDEMQNNERGTNEMSMSKATGFLIMFEQINKVLFDELKLWLFELNLLDSVTELYLENLRKLSLLRKINLMNYDQQFEHEFDFDIEYLINTKFLTSLDNIMLKKPKKYKIEHTLKQKETIKNYLNEFGQTQDGMGKMLMRYPHVYRIFRIPQAV
jgi:radical SAM superfamily enzyme YgiQ (UPF0313 family)